MRDRRRRLRGDRRHEQRGRGARPAEPPGELEGLVNAQGGAIEDLAERAQAALDRGDLDEARELVERLEFYRALFESGPRGEALAGLVSPTDAEFAALVEQGTIQAGDDSNNRRYFQIPPAPGQGILVMDLFIPGESAGPLRGDGRDPRTRCGTPTSRRPTRARRSSSTARRGAA